ncbi:hypothetical protein B0H10DRAFT_1945091 [Mycena sp. CBHHK59/15]|nr:hypothetical protein B0H10DRAFT_1945091 [Mycena sp. CBHHK59/15]
MALSDTPLFRKIHWNSRTMQDGTWKTLTSAQVRPDYAPFLAAVQLLDTAGFLADIMDCDLVDRRLVLGLSLSYPGIGATSIGSKSNYGTGESQVWGCILHFQVLDLILSWMGFAPNENHLDPTNSEPLPKGHAKHFIKSLLQWPSKLAELDQELLEEDVESGSVVFPTGSNDAESLSPLIALTQIKGVTRKAKTLKNLQGMATALMWILELGTSIAPVTTSAGKLAINPKNKAALRYNGRLSTIEQILRPLSYALNFSPLLAFTAEKDLQHLHIDLNTQLQMHGLLSSRSGEALIYMEHILFSLIKATCVATGVDTVMKSDFKTLRDAMPSQSHADTALFTVDLQLPPRPQSPSYHPGRLPGLSTSTLHPPLQPTHKYSVIPYQEPHMNIDYTTRRPLARALSQAPHNHGHPANTMMTPYSALDPISQTELVGKKGLLRLDAPAPIAEPVPEKSLSGEKMEIDVEVEEQPVVEGSALEDAMQVDVAAPPSPIILVVPRKSLRLQEPCPPPVIVDSEVPASTTKSTCKRKSKGSQGGTKKRIKDTDEVANDDGDEDESSGEEEEGDRTHSKEGDQTHVGLDTEWTDNAHPGYWRHDLRDIPIPLERSTKYQQISCYLPDGVTLRTLDYIGHSASVRPVVCTAGHTE